MKRLGLKSVLGVLFTSCIAAFAQTISSPAGNYPGGEGISERQAPQEPKRENRVIKSGLLAPSAQDRTDHERFLTQSNTGLIRLLPREVFDWRVYNTPKKIGLRGGGAYYSFAFISHEYGWGSDIELDHGKLSSGFTGADIGILANLGDVDLDTLSLNDRRVNFLATYKPPNSERNARIEQERFLYGFNVDGIDYRRTLPALVGSTYLVRSVVYRTSDMLVAFRVVREDTDGSLIIAWKRLKRYGTPNLRPLLAL